MPNPKVAVIAAITAVALVVPGAAVAQIDPGVNYDPGSPAGKEYAIPLVEGRSEGAGTTNQREGANIPFGVGITPRGSKQGATRAGTKDRSRGSDRRDPIGARAGESSEEVAARIARAEDPGATAGRTILLALAVLAPATLLALLLMQRTQASRTGRTA